ncbi:MAG TPA: sigma-70 family RNA polymerase sigma factor [Phycisphaerae bacterium]|nr:sigma-70 family RNA polymerase sigma factor [Phycisphaerae bacterium]HOI56362.1 sigma-70 family RNA polymerase sigma factor [Phycisphaerae bacterium]
MARSLRTSAVGSLAAAVPVVAMDTADQSAAATLDLDTLLSLAQGGDEKAFGQLVARFERMVHGLIFRQTRDAALSEDLAQDVFMRLWQVLPAFTTAAALASWLKTVSVNAVISHWRQVDSQRRRIEAMAQAFPGQGSSGPVARLIEEEDRDQVRAALDMLPADLRSILTLRIYEELSYEELAEMLALEVGTVRSRLFRARQMIKETLERWRQQDERHFRQSGSNDAAS